jgi:hypothetical protein
LHRAKFAKENKGPKSSRFAAKHLNCKTIIRTLNQRVPGSSPGAPTNPCNLAGNTEGGMASSKPDRLREFRAIR